MVEFIIDRQSYTIQLRCDSCGQWWKFDRQHFINNNLENYLKQMEKWECQTCEIENHHKRRCAEEKVLFEQKLKDGTLTFHDIYFGSEI